jgi:hypothetical protein
MPLTLQRFAATAAALVFGLTACGNQREAASPSPATLSPANKAATAQLAKRLMAEDAAATREHRQEMARLIVAGVAGYREHDRTISLLLHIQNKSAKTIRLFDAGLNVHTLAPDRRVGLAEVETERIIPPHASVEFWLPLRYLRFGEDAGTMRLAQGKPKHIALDVTEIKYTDGTDAGYDD